MLPDQASPLLPCSWETVTFRQAQLELYTMKKTTNVSRIRIRVTVDPEAEVFSDEFSYPTMAFVNNIFGLLGLYLGYCILDFYEMTEKLGVITGKRAWFLFKRGCGADELSTGKTEDKADEEIKNG
jgi:hypothetical protein